VLSDDKKHRFNGADAGQLMESILSLVPYDIRPAARVDFQTAIQLAILDEKATLSAGGFNAREWQQTLVDVTNALAERIKNDDPYTAIVAQARKFLRKTADAVDAAPSTERARDVAEIRRQISLAVDMLKSCVAVPFTKGERDQCVKHLTEAFRLTFDGQSAPNAVVQPECCRGLAPVCPIPECDPRNSAENSLAGQGTPEMTGRAAAPVSSQDGPLHERKPCESALSHVAPMGEEPVLERVINGKVAGIDASIAPLVDAVNAAGFRTIASCSGHGYRPGSIALADGRELVIARSYEEARLIGRIFPIGANGELVDMDYNAPRSSSVPNFEPVIRWVDEHPHPTDPTSRVQMYMGDWKQIVAALRSATVPTFPEKPIEVVAEGEWAYSGNGRAYKAEELNNAAWHKYREACASSAIGGKS
jgi:hypothetical protein